MPEISSYKSVETTELLSKLDEKYRTKSMKRTHNIGVSDVYGQDEVDRKIDLCVAKYAAKKVQKQAKRFGAYSIGFRSLENEKNDIIRERKAEVQSVKHDLSALKALKAEIASIKAELSTRVLDKNQIGKIKISKLKAEFFDQLNYLTGDAIRHEVGSTIVCWHRTMIHLRKPPTDAEVREKRSSMLASTFETVSNNLKEIISEIGEKASAEAETSMKEMYNAALSHKTDLAAYKL